MKLDTTQEHEKHDYAQEPVILDIDGTICENGHGIRYDSPQSVRQCCRPFPEAVSRMEAMLGAGWSPFFLTHRASTLLSVTYAQVAEWCGEAVAQRADLWHSDHASYEGVERWELLADMVLQKGDALRDLAKRTPALIYVGDRLQDLYAASAAGVRFMWAHEWRAGAPFSDAVDARLAMQLRGGVAA